MNLTRSKTIRRFAHFGIVTLMILASTLLGPMSTSSAGDGPSDSCSTIVGVISRAGLNAENSAPAFGCRQAANGDWYIPPIAATNDNAVIDQLTPFGKSLLEAVDRMSMDRAFSSSVQFDRERSIAYIVGAGGEMDPMDISTEPIAFGLAPNSRLRDVYSESVMLYFTRTLGAEADLVHYMEWFMARRDLTLMTLANNFNPLAAMGFTDKWGYQQFPWPWQLADPAAIAAYTGQGVLDFSPEQTPPPALHPTSTPRHDSGSGDMPPPSTSGSAPSNTLLISPDQLKARPGESLTVNLRYPQLQGIHSIAFMAYGENVAFSNLSLVFVDRTGDGACSSGATGDVVPPRKRATPLSPKDIFPPNALELVVDADARPGDLITICVEMVGFSNGREVFWWNAQASIEIVECCLANRHFE